MEIFPWINGVLYWRHSSNKIRRKASKRTAAATIMDAAEIEAEALTEDVGEDEQVRYMEHTTNRESRRRIRETSSVDTGSGLHSETALRQHHLRFLQEQTLP